ncbi:HTH domain-containing protein, partial [Bacilliculturomica massiliensis]|uniref:HTH domain-containing protein n=1 Tax=Bacilliculturomica massiliensis TaxID=1917867 RepID=UPI002ED1D648
MSKIPFTEEQIKLLQENPYTYNITPNTLYLTKEFKELFYQEYRKGKLPRQILEEHGFPMSILGE